MVVRRLGDSVADMVNSPSDGKERPVADGIFVYSSAPSGPPVRIVARPSIIRAITGAVVRMRVAAVDAAYQVAANGPTGARERFTLARSASFATVNSSRCIRAPVA